MNKVILMGNLTKDPETRTSTTGNSVSRYSLAINNGENADFINCVAFGKGSDFAERYLHKGMKILVEGRIKTGSYTDKDGKKVYTTDVVVDRHEFCESKRTDNNSEAASFVNIPDIPEEELPFE